MDFEWEMGHRPFLLPGDSESKPAAPEDLRHQNYMGLPGEIQTEGG
jgi:hypothetical protein